MLFSHYYSCSYLSSLDRANLYTMFSYMVSIVGYLGWALNFMLHYSFFQSHHPLREEELTWYCTDNILEQKEPVECAVCLCKIEHGQEDRELRCNHQFHRVCIDRWLEHQGFTCPLCRDFVSPPRLFTELGMEVLVLKYRSFGCSDRDTWWLR
ncbi:hypothetical protein K2173_015068 [Erythroxylum novogranatense]|uniref:RING-type domain-containing protein n=1 Tax=Erythroxylum novogranatense TaxID=1862640 RepID=A0AAV8T0W7_9ROSI|nr:hypothetical protein K2173_015068 [Erythroxylum novogranatense]